ncbi:MAG: hypothetical protein ACLVLH_08575 [Eisenbergiella massiliensis]
MSRTLEKIPAVTVVYDRRRIGGAWQRMYDPGKLPLAVTRAGMTGIYASSGYNGQCGLDA